MQPPEWQKPDATDGLPKEAVVSEENTMKRLPLIPHFVALALPFALVACQSGDDTAGISSTADPTVTSLLNAVESEGDEIGEAEAVGAGLCGQDEVRGRARRHAAEEGVIPPDQAEEPVEGDDAGIGRGGRGGRGGHGGRGQGQGRGHGRGGERVERLLFIYDVDGDGTLSEAEQAEVQADLAARCEARQAALLAEFDADDDGALSEAELEAARAAHEAEREARHEDMLAEFDADGDGVLIREEHDAAHEARRAEAEAARAALEAQFDADGDGTLSDAELAALREERRARIRSGERPV